MSDEKEMNPTQSGEGEVSSDTTTDGAVEAPATGSLQEAPASAVLVKCQTCQKDIARKGPNSKFCDSRLTEGSRDIEFSGLENLAEVWRASRTVPWRRTESFLLDQRRSSHEGLVREGSSTATRSDPSGASRRGIVESCR